MPHYQEVGRPIEVGDDALYGGERGRVVFVVEDGVFLTEYQPSAYWSGFYGGRGIGVECEINGLFFLPEPDEDLILVSWSSEPDGARP